MGLFWKKESDNRFKPRTKEEKLLVEMYQSFSRKYYDPNLNAIENKEKVVDIIYQTLKERRQKKLLRKKPLLMEIIACVMLLFTSMVLLFVAFY